MRFARRLRRRLLRRALGAALAACLASAALAGPTGAMPDSPCREWVCSASMTVDAAPSKWASIERFYPYNEDMSVTLSAGGKTLRAASSGGPNGCRNSYRGEGIVATVRVCGAETQLRVRAKRTKEGMVDLGIAYQATPFLDDEGL